MARAVSAPACGDIAARYHATSILPCAANQSVVPKPQLSNHAVHAATHVCATRPKPA